MRSKNLDLPSSDSDESIDSPSVSSEDASSSLFQRKLGKQISGPTPLHVLTSGLSHYVGSPAGASQFQRSTGLVSANSPMRLMPFPREVNALLQELSFHTYKVDKGGRTKDDSPTQKLSSPKKTGFDLYRISVAGESPSVVPPPSNIASSRSSVHLTNCEMHYFYHIKSLMTAELAMMLRNEIFKSEQEKSKRKRERFLLELAPSKRTNAELEEIFFELRKLDIFAGKTLDSPTEYARAFKFTTAPSLSLILKPEDPCTSYYYIQKGIVAIFEPNPRVIDWAKKRQRFLKLYQWYRQSYLPKVETLKEKEEAAKQKKEQQMKEMQARSMQSMNFLNATPNVPKQSSQQFKLVGTAPSSPASRKSYNRRVSITAQQLLQQMKPQGESRIYKIKELSSEETSILETFPPDSSNNLSQKDKKLVAEYLSLAKEKFYILKEKKASGDTIGSVSGDVKEGTAYLALTDCFLFEVTKRDFTRTTKKIDQKAFEQKVEFFRSLPCFNQIGKNLLKRLMTNFKQERIGRGIQVYGQGDTAKKAYVIFAGDFDIIRRKRNFLTRKEQEYKQIRNLNERRKPSPERIKKKKTMKEAKGKDAILEPSFIKLTTLGVGNMFGHEDIVAGRNYTVSVRCVSNYGIIYSIESEEFVDKMQRNDRVWNMILKDCYERDQMTKQKIIQASDDHSAYSQFFEKVKLREKWNQKHNINTMKGMLDDWRATFKQIVIHTRSNSPKKGTPASLAEGKEDPTEININESQVTLPSRKKAATAAPSPARSGARSVLKEEGDWEMLKEAKEETNQTIKFMKKEYTSQRQKMVGQDNTKIANFIDKYMAKEKNVFHIAPPAKAKKHEPPKPRSSTRQVVKELKEKKELKKMRAVERMERASFRQMLASPQMQQQPTMTKTVSKTSHRHLDKSQARQDSQELTQSRPSKTRDEDTLSLSKFLSELTTDHLLLKPTTSNTNKPRLAFSRSPSQGEQSSSDSDAQEVEISANLVRAEKKKIKASSMVRRSMGARLNRQNMEIKTRLKGMRNLGMDKLLSMGQTPLVMKSIQVASTMGKPLSSLSHSKKTTMRGGGPSMQQSQTFFAQRTNANTSGMNKQTNLTMSRCQSPMDSRMMSPMEQKSPGYLSNKLATMTLTSPKGLAPRNNRPRLVLPKRAVFFKKQTSLIQKETSTCQNQGRVGDLALETILSTPGLPMELLSPGIRSSGQARPLSGINSPRLNW